VINLTCFTNKARPLLLMALLAFTLVGVSGCAIFEKNEPLQLASSGTIPGAQGEVKVGNGDNDNTKLDVEVKHLAEPSKLTPGATTFVVWVKPVGTETPQSLGALKVDKDLEGELKTVTPHRDFELFITAEASPTVPGPTGNSLLWGNVSRK
jgi:hypothetical protein